MELPHHVGLSTVRIVLGAMAVELPSAACGPQDSPSPKKGPASTTATTPRDLNGRVILRFILGSAPAFVRPRLAMSYYQRLLEPVTRA